MHVPKVSSGFLVKAKKELTVANILKDVILFRDDEVGVTCDGISQCDEVGN